MILSRKYAFMRVVRRCSNKIGDVDVNYKLPDVLKDIENRSSERIQAMKSNLEIKIDSKFDSLGGMLKGEFDNLSGQIKRQSIGFSIFGALFCTTIGILGKIVYDAMQKKRDK